MNIPIPAQTPDPNIDKPTLPPTEPAAPPEEEPPQDRPCGLRNRWRKATRSPSPDDDKEFTMPVRIENQICYFTVDDNGQEQSLPASQVTVSTDSEKSMSFVALNDDRIYITEVEADALTVAGAQDGRKHLKASDSDSVI